MNDVTTEILKQIRADIREARDVLSGQIGVLEGRLDDLEGRMDTVEYALRGMASDVKQIPEMLRLMRQIADAVVNHEQRITRLES